MKKGKNTNIPLFQNGEENGKVIQNPHVDPDQHDNLITYRGSPFVHAYHVWSTSVTTIVSHPAHRQNERQTEQTKTELSQHDLYSDIVNVNRTKKGTDITENFYNQLIYQLSKITTLSLKSF